MSTDDAERLKARVDRVAAALEESSVDVLLVDSPFDIRYLSGFTGSNGLVLVVGSVAAAKLGRHRFLTDFRYTSQSAEQVPDAFDRVIVTGELLEGLGEQLGAGEWRLGFDESRVTVKGHRRLEEVLPEGWRTVACSGAVERLRAVKEPAEVERMRAAAALADEALAGVLEGGLAGRSEREVALDLEVRMRRLGAQAPSFGSIVASGAHGALPHAEPRDELIARDVLVTIDWGAQLDGYCSDCTRTYATGEGISELAREIYALVLDAQEMGVATVRPGISGREVDAIAREVIERAGHGEHFGHGLGHGVGMEVHEAPRLSRLASEQPLVAGNAVTVEPGVYLPGELGVRIEDLLVLGDDSQDVLTSLSKALTVVS
ncbi:MAG TPA: Xaa-Pro peptidase family protein [Solirubrobacteraceae bacterium]